MRAVPDWTVFDLLMYRDQGRSISDLVAYRTENDPGWLEAARLTPVGRGREKEIKLREQVWVVNGGIVS